MPIRTSTPLPSPSICGVCGSVRLHYRYSKTQIYKQLLRRTPFHSKLLPYLQNINPFLGHYTVHTIHTVPTLCLSPSKVHSFIYLTIPSLTFRNTTQHLKKPSRPDPWQCNEFLGPPSPSPLSPPPSPSPSDNTRSSVQVNEYKNSESSSGYFPVPIPVHS